MSSIHVNLQCNDIEIPAVVYSSGLVEIHQAYHDAVYEYGATIVPQNIEIHEIQTDEGWFITEFEYQSLFTIPDLVKSVLGYSFDTEIKERTVHKVFGQCVEEMGEISTAIFRPFKATEEAQAEAVDLMLAAIDLFYVLEKENNPDITKEQIISKMNSIAKQKCEKWKTNSLKG